MIEVTHLTKTYGKKQNVFTALDDISLRIPRNASVAIVGKSGSGKSTLMHAISGLDRPQTGQVLIDGEDILRLSRRRMDAFRAHTMGFIFQSFFVEAGETCYNNVRLVYPAASASSALPLRLRPWGLMTRCIVRPVIYLVGRSSAWRLPEPSLVSQRFCLPMSQPATWILELPR